MATKPKGVTKSDRLKAAGSIRTAADAWDTVGNKRPKTGGSARLEAARLRLVAEAVEANDVLAVLLATDGLSHVDDEGVIPEDYHLPNGDPYWEE